MSTPYLVAVQNAVAWERRGVATSSVQFFRTIGGAVAVAALGAVLNTHLAEAAPGLDPNVALNPELRQQVPAAALSALRGALAQGLHAVYLSGAAVAFLAVVVGLMFPRGSARSQAHEARHPLAAEHER
jgi:hypothetical protein